MRTGIALIFLVAIGRTGLGATNIKEESECGVQEFTCGERQADHTGKYNVFYHGGLVETDSGQWPWYATVNVLTDEVFFEFKCSAVLISEKHILTSRLCVTDETGSMISIDRFLIRVGTHKQYAFNFGFARHRKVSKIHQPVDFDKNSANKVAILEMSAAVKFNKYVQPVCIMEDVKEHFISHYAIGRKIVDGNEHLGTIVYRIFETPMNKTHLCNRDRGSIFLELSSNTYLWTIAAIVDCEGERVYIFVKDYLRFIINVTNLSYLQIFRKGKPFDPSQRYPNLLLQRNCGLSFAKHTRPRSSDARMYEFPWIAQVHVFYPKRGWSVDCLGSLLNYRYVLGGHCVLATYRKKIKVRLGEYDLTQDPDCSSEDNTDCSLPFREYDIEYATVPRDLDGSEHIVSIVLLRSSKDIRFEDHIQPVCLPVSPELRRMAPSEYIYTSWEFRTFSMLLRIPHSILQKRSYTASANVYECLQQTQESVWSEEKLCIPKIYKEFESDSALLGQYVYNAGIARFVQFGFVSYGGTVNVSFYMDWIVANMEE